MKKSIWTAAGKALTAQRQAQASLMKTIRCPTCRTVGLVRKISVGRKVGSVTLFGLFAAGRLAQTMTCDACGYRW